MLGSLVSFLPLSESVCFSSIGKLSACGLRVSEVSREWSGLPGLYSLPG